jgi:DNA invertase Pin-like site-specific DNA recombinase
MGKKVIENLTAIGWVRVSTTGQERYSPEDQEASIRRYVADYRPQLKLGSIVRTTETGWRKGKRTEFHALLDRIRRENIGHLITMNAERLSRDIRYTPEIVDLIEERGLWVHYSENGDVANPSNIKDKETKMGEDAVYAKRYIRDLQTKMRRSMEGRLARGIYPINRITYGYERKREANGKAAQNISPSADAPIVRKMFTLYATGRESEFTLWEKMRAEGCRLSPSAVGQLLRSPVVIGYFPWPWPEAKFVQDPIGENGKKDPYTLGKWIRGGWEPIVERDVWDRVQEITKLRSRPHPVREKQLWMRYRGLLKCQCPGGGRYYTGVIHGKWRYYQPNHKSEKRVEWCSEKMISAKVLDEKIEEALKRFEFPPETYNRLRASLQSAKRDNNKDVRAETARLEAEVRTVDALIDKALDRAITAAFRDEEISAKVQALRDRKAKAEATLARLSRDKARFIDDSLAMLELVSDIEGCYRRASEAHKAELLRTLFREIEVKDGELIFHPDPVFEVFFPLSKNPSEQPAVDRVDPFVVGQSQLRDSQPHEFLAPDLGFHPDLLDRVSTDIDGPGRPRILRRDDPRRYRQTAWSALISASSLSRSIGGLVRKYSLISGTVSERELTRAYFPRLKV